jgi:U6 snRNA-associated Sm-like protein LSm5
MVVPLELLKENVGQSVWLITKDPREYTGILRGFDEYVNVVLDEAVEYEPLPGSPTVYAENALGRILLNGNAVEVIVPKGLGPNQ